MLPARAVVPASTEAQPVHPYLAIGGSRKDGQTVSAIPQIIHPTSTAERWASYVLGACKSDRDPRTLQIWAHQVAVSYTTLCESCRLIEVAPRCARDFARVLRLIVMPSFDPCVLGSLLDVGDRRTLDSIVQKSGFGQHTTFLRQVSVVSFLDSQHFIARENTGLKVVREVFAVGVVHEKSDKYSNGNCIAWKKWSK
jgi:hypothetical protein